MSSSAVSVILSQKLGSQYPELFGALPRDQDEGIRQARAWLKEKQGGNLKLFVADVLIKSFGSLSTFRGNSLDKTSYAFEKIQAPDTQEVFVKNMAEIIRRLTEGVPYSSSEANEELVEAAFNSQTSDPGADWASELLASIRSA